MSRIGVLLFVVGVVGLVSFVAVVDAARPSLRPNRFPPGLIPSPATDLSSSSSAASPPWTNYTQKQYWFTSQKLDHFDLSGNTPNWSQRYWIVDDFWTGGDGTGPIFHYLCGEYTCPGVNPDRLFPLELAYEHKAMVVVVEHRFYGESQPFAGQAEPASLNNLVYLNSRQALGDLAEMQLEITNQIQERYHPRHKNKWIVIGGSYPGALSAWYRLKYPHLYVSSFCVCV